MGDPESEFERRCLHLKGAQVVTGARQTGVPLEEPKDRCELDTEMRVRPPESRRGGTDAQGEGFGIVCYGLRGPTARLMIFSAANFASGSEAKSSGVTKLSISIPLTVLARADAVIE